MLRELEAVAKREGMTVRMLAQAYLEYVMDRMDTGKLMLVHPCAALEGRAEG